MEEVWMPIDGYQSIYEVSNLGRIRRTKQGRTSYLKGRKNNRGYLGVSLCSNGERKEFLVHRLVASAFCKRPDGCDVVNHIDNDPRNNTASNLEWTTQKRNVHHAASVGAMTVRPVVRSDGKSEIYYQSISEVEKDGFVKSCVWNCCNGKTRLYKGFSWRYA